MDAQPRFYDARLDTVILRVRLTPNAARMGIGGVFTDADGRAWLRASVTVVPEKGRANAALIEMLAKKLKIRKSAFTILSGETDRHKTLRIEGIDPDSCAALI
ncbi:MAG: DUF167 domain-containing protein [Rhodospirillales bacterium]|nr:DUF167 domain-containing protein [Alphaproteobacteria bacterium]MCB9986972.1 DUF167 domain-containing protein [Rhodospirillales bacterium]USO08577.1 MAG: DUF167 domain-containing protein [Rhodospirillales bacterium]